MDAALEKELTEAYRAILLDWDNGGNAKAEEKKKNLFRIRNLMLEKGYQGSEIQNILSEVRINFQSNNENLFIVNENSSTAEELSTRHKSVRFLAHFSNVIGWIFVISIIGIPIGLSLLLFGHMALASIETEHNTRETANTQKLILQELRDK